jgi:phosphoesterase RecJ-like protein
MNEGVSSEIVKLAPVILAEIKNASSILLHCHPKPDPDSVGSALAMKLALEQMGKKATVIKGDSEIPQAFMNFPGAGEIVRKNFFELDLSQFDLFIAQDSSSKQMISRWGQFGESMPIRTVVIDHHRSSERYGHVNLVEDSYPATAQVLSDLFQVWGVSMTQEIAANLFMGIYSDTGGFKYRGASGRTFEIAARLVSTGIDFYSLLDDVENSRTPASIAYERTALSNIEYFLGGTLVICTVPYDVIKSEGITESDMGGVQIASILRTVVGWDLDVGMVELKPGEIKMGFRTRDEKRFDVSKIAVAFGGGGHRAASGAGITGKSLAEAKALVVAKAKELYNL